MFNPNFPHYLSTMMLADSNAINHRRHTARESTGPLKGWLQEHPRNPYPTKAEKVMLALISGNGSKRFITKILILKQA